MLCQIHLCWFSRGLLSIVLTAAAIFSADLATAAQNCVSLIGGATNAAETYVAKVPGLFDKISIRRTIQLQDGAILHFEDFNDGSALESQVVAKRGEQVLWRGHLELVVKGDELILEVIAIDGDQVPGFIKPVDHIFLNENGIPLSSFLLMRGMKLLGLEDITKFRIEKIRHAESVIDIAQMLHEKNKVDGSYLVSADEILNVFKNRALHRLAMTALLQAGFRVDKIQLSPGENQISVPGTSQVKTMFAPKDFDQDGVVSIRLGSELSLGQFKSAALEKKKFEKRLAFMMDQHPELKDLLVDFSVVYFLGLY
jgi:hypothetical protein